MSKVAVFIAHGSEELETVTLIDILRRADLDLDVISTCDKGALSIVASRGVKLQADIHLNQCKLNNYSMLILPGGLKGSEAFSANPQLISLLNQRSSQQWLVAMCAAPALVLHPHQLLGNAKWTCHPSFWPSLNHTHLSEQRVVIDAPHKLATSQGPGTAIEFSLTLVDLIFDAKKAKQIADALVL